MAEIAEAQEFQDEFTRKTVSPLANLNPEHIWAARQCLKDGEIDTVRIYFLGTGLVRIHDLNADEATKAQLRPDK